MDLPAGPFTELGQQAIEILRERRTPISFVILDLTMPEMSGIKTYRAIKELVPDVKVLQVSNRQRVRC